MSNRVYYWQVDLALQDLLEDIRMRCDTETVPFKLIRKFDKYDCLKMRFEAQKEK